MQPTDKPQTKSLSQIVSQIEDRKERAINGILIFRYAKRERIELEQPLAYNFEPGFADYIINTLADMCLNLKIPPKKDAHHVVFPSVKPEIEMVYKVIKKNAGVSGSGKEVEEKRKQAALRYFDENKHIFKAIKREYLEDRYLYQFAKRQGIRDFEKRILKKIIKNTFPDSNINFSEDALWKAYREVTKK